MKIDIKDFKIRCWIPENKFMLYSDRLNVRQDYCIYFEDDGIKVEYLDTIWKIVDAIPMQSLNIKDKNNKEVYEHDVALFESGRICEVVPFNSPSYCGYDLVAMTTVGSAPGKRVWNSFVVIGNTFEGYI